MSACQKPCGRINTPTVRVRVHFIAVVRVRVCVHFIAESTQCEAFRHASAVPAIAWRRGGIGCLIWDSRGICDENIYSTPSHSLLNGALASCLRTCRSPVVQLGGQTWCFRRALLSGRDFGEGGRGGRGRGECEIGEGGVGEAIAQKIEDF